MAPDAVFSVAKIGMPPGNFHTGDILQWEFMTIEMIGLLAIDTHRALLSVKAKKSILSDAYRAWKCNNDLEHAEPIHPGGFYWEQMLLATKSEWAALKEAKRIHKNSARKLARRIQKEKGRI